MAKGLIQLSRVNHEGIKTCSSDSRTPLFVHMLVENYLFFNFSNHIQEKVVSLQSK